MQRALPLLRALDNHLQTQNLLLLSLSSSTSISFNSSNPRKYYTTDETTKPNGHDLVNMIRNSTIQGNVFHGKQLHCYVLRSGFAANVFVGTALVSFYAKLLSLDDAHQLFDDMPQPNVVTWNTIISGYLHSGKLHKALCFFLDLIKSDLRADAYSFSSALAACGHLCLLPLGMSIQSRIVMCGLESSVVVANCLIDMYGKCGSVDDAIRMFDGLVEKDVISWNSVIAASARNQRLQLASAYFSQMPCPDTISYNELIGGIAQFGDIDEAIEILRSMKEPNSSSWNSIITGYMVRGRPWEALNFFTQIHANGGDMDEYTFSSVLSGITSVSAITWGTLLHCYTIKCGLVKSTIIGSALIDMYSKCGQLKDAEMVFHLLASKNIVSWNAMISGFAHNGDSHKVIQYFEELKGVKGLHADDITFVNLLAAWSHNKMPLEKAYEYFTSMINDYGIQPRPEHLSSLIRLMGRHGDVRRAEMMIHELGFGSCSSVWRALLGACEAYGDLDVARFAAAKLMELVGNDEFGYVVLSNMNKGHGNWVDATAAWKLMREQGVVKEAGFSRIESGKTTYVKTGF